MLLPADALPFHSQYFIQHYLISHRIVLDLEEFESNSVLEFCRLVALRSRNLKPFVHNHPAIRCYITTGSTQYLNNMDVQPLQMVIELEIPPEFWDLTIAPGCWLWVPLVLREHHAHLDEGLRTTQAQGREFFPFPVGETELTRTFRRGEYVSMDLNYSRYLLCYFRHLMYCTCPNPWGKVGILIHNVSGEVASVLLLWEKTSVAALGTSFSRSMSTTTMP